MRNGSRRTLLILTLLFIVSLCGCQKPATLEAGKNDLNPKMSEAQKERLRNRDKE